nr:hypothetical protein [Arthrobacter sp. Soil762]
MEVVVVGQVNGGAQDVGQRKMDISQQRLQVAEHGLALLFNPRADKSTVVGALANDPGCVGGVSVAYEMRKRGRRLMKVRAEVMGRHDLLSVRDSP